MKRLAVPALLLLAGNADPNAPIEITVSGVRSAQGMVRVSVCPESTFLKKCPWSASTPARLGEVQLVIDHVPPGRYAVQAFHDANSDGKLDKSWFGLPNEGVGFSNDAMAHLTLPRFAKAGFEHGSTVQHIPVKVRYFLG